MILCAGCEMGRELCPCALLRPSQCVLGTETSVFCFHPQEPTAGLGIILDSVCGMFPHLLTPLLQLLQALVSDKSTAKKVEKALVPGRGSASGQG